MFDIARIKAIPIAVVAADLGFVLSPRGYGRCCLPGHLDKRPSFTLRTASNGFTCFACQKSGSVIDLVMAKDSVDFPQACQWLNDRYLANSGRTPPIRRAPVPAPVAAAVPDDANAFDPELYGWILAQSPLGPTGRAYLGGRAISPNTTAHFRIGQVGDRSTLYRRAASAFGLERLSRAGLVTNGQWGPRLIFPSAYLLFPFLREGAVAYLQARRADDGRDYRWVCPANLPPPAYNLDVLASSASTITICEGVTDVLSAHELGMAPIGLLGAMRDLTPEIIDRLTGRNVAIFADADRSGRALADRLTRRLAARGITVVTKELPTGSNDLNDYLRSRRGRG